MKISRSVLTGTFVLFGTVAMLHPLNVRAQTNADITNNAFQTTVQLNVNNFTYTSVAIPTGKRLVVQNINIYGAAQTTGAYVVPIAIIASGLGSSNYNYTYYSPTPSLVDSTQFYQNYQTTFYADSLQVGPAFAGFTPSFMALNVAISGYLVDAPKASASANVNALEQGPDVKLLGNRNIVPH
jgi:hypothetical protein